MWYSIPLAAGIDSVTILSVGGSTTKRACMQALYVLQGDYAVTHTSLADYPCTLSDMASYYVHLAENVTDSVISYSITNARGDYREQKVVFTATAPSLLKECKDERKPVRKYIKDRQIIIERENNKYSVLGTKVKK